MWARCLKYIFGDAELAWFVSVRILRNDKESMWDGNKSIINPPGPSISPRPARDELSGRLLTGCFNVV